MTRAAPVARGRSLRDRASAPPPIGPGKHVLERIRRPFLRSTYLDAAGFTACVEALLRARSGEWGKQCRDASAPHVIRARRNMSLAIARLGADDRPHADLRTLVENDASNLASLMLLAYRGTPDGEGRASRRQWPRFEVLSKAVTGR